MKNKEYWGNRIKIAQDKTLDRIYDEYVANIEKQYNTAILDIEKDILSWYQRFADNNKLSFAEAQKLLKSDELEEFKWTVQQYIEKGMENGISADWAKELENASARVHISRLESLKYQLRAHAEELTQGRIKNIENAAKLAYTQGYYQTAYEFQKEIGVGFSLQSIDQRKLTKVLDTPWTTDNQTFTARCWNDKAKLVECVNQEITRMIATGAAPKKAIENISKQMKASRNNAGRVVMTESAFFATQAQKECYEELGAKEYRVIETLDRSTCSFCGEMDGKVFPVGKMQAGATAPPFHPWCRGTTAPYYEDLVGVGERFARDIETGEAYYLPAETTYEQWKDLQEAKYGNGSVDTARKKAYNNGQDSEQFARYQEVLKELCPKNLLDFQKTKYDNPKQWNKLKYQYRTVNQYKIDSGSLSVQEILDFDEIVISEKRGNFTSKYKKSGNIAGAYLDGNIKDLYLAHSKIGNEKEANKYKGNATIVTLKDARIFEYIDVPKANGGLRSDTYFDTEAKLFEFFSEMYDIEKYKSITMLSERGMCDSCKGVMSQFKEKYPNVAINVISNKRVEGDVWKHRRKKR